MKEELIEKIEAYLQSELSIDELRSYAEREHITDLDEKIEWVENTVLAIEAQGLKDQLSQVFPMARKPEAKVRNLSTSKWIAGLAASVLLVVFAYWGLQHGQEDRNSYAQYEYQERGLPVTMSQSDNYRLYDALTYFGEENYKTAIEKLEAIGGEKSDTLAYYLGASYYYSNDFVKAISNLKSPIVRAGTFGDEASWILVLSYLKSNEPKKAVPILKNLTNSNDNQFYDRATKLLAEIEN